MYLCSMGRDPLWEYEDNGSAEVAMGSLSLHVVWCDVCGQPKGFDLRFIVSLLFLTSLQTFLVWCSLSLSLSSLFLSTPSRGVKQKACDPSKILRHSSANTPDSPTVIFMTPFFVFVCLFSFPRLFVIRHIFCGSLLLWAAQYKCWMCNVLFRWSHLTHPHAHTTHPISLTHPPAHPISLTHTPTPHIPSHSLTRLHISSSGGLFRFIQLRPQVHYCRSAGQGRRVVRDRPFMSFLLFSRHTSCFFLFPSYLSLDT